MTTPILKNLVHVVRRFKLATILNVLGLSVAFAAFMVIMMQLNFHFSFDRFHKNYDKIFRLETTDFARGEGYQSSIARPFFEAFIASSPHIVSGFRHEHGSVRFHIYVENDGERLYFQEHRTRVTPEFTDVFTLDFVQGSGDALKTPNTILIPLSLSQRLFGNESAIGRHLFLDSWYWTVGGVYRDFPSNSIWNNVIFAPLPEGQNQENWGNWNYPAYIRVNDASNVPAIIENFNRIISEGTLIPEAFLEWIGSDITVRLTALPNIHFVSDVRGDSTPKANPQMLMILFAIGIIIIIIAAINFTNFSTALTPMRIRNINTQRVFGAQQRTIRWVLLFEAIVFCIVSYFAALLLVKMFRDSPLSNLISADLSLMANLPVLLGTALVAIVVGIIAGFYPSRYMTSFAPALALKGNFGLSPKGKMIRNTLISIQFVASIALIIIASFMYLQNRFMQNVPLGFDRDGLITVDVRNIQDRAAFENQIKAFAWVEGITYTRELLSSTEEQAINRWGEVYRGEQISIRVIPAHYAILDVLGIPIIEGRGLRQEDEGAGNRVWVFNESARNEFGLEVGSSLDGNRGEIIGFFSNIHYASFRTAVEPMGFFVDGGYRHRVAYIRVRAGTDMRMAMAQVRATLAEFNPNYPFQVRFFDEVLQQLYEDEIRLGLLILVFSLIAILISIVGVFGLVVFDSECRRKEIGIRKVHGASTMEIITMFNKSYFAILLICFVVAVPIAWIAVNRWLENFAYRTPMYWWVYLVAFLAVAVITVVTVTVQNWRVANEDPVKFIKTE